MDQPMCAAFRCDESVPDFQDDRGVGIFAHYALSAGVVQFTQRVIAAQLLPAQSPLGCASWLRDGLLPRSSKPTFCSRGRCLAAVGCANPADWGGAAAGELRDAARGSGAARAPASTVHRTATDFGCLPAGGFAPAPADQGPVPLAALFAIVQ